MCAQLRAQAGSPGAEGDRLTLLLAAGKVARGGVDRLVKSRRKFADLQELAAVTGRARRRGGEVAAGGEAVGGALPDLPEEDWQGLRAADLPAAELKPS